MGEIVEASIGPINVVECVKEPGTCAKAHECDTRWVYERINDGITALLADLSLQDLLDHASANGSVPDECLDARAPASGPGEG